MPTYPLQTVAFQSQGAARKLGQPHVEFIMNYLVVWICEPEHTTTDQDTTAWCTRTYNSIRPLLFDASTSSGVVATFAPGYVCGYCGMLGSIWYRWGNIIMVNSGADMISFVICAIFVLYDCIYFITRATCPEIFNYLKYP